MATSFSGALDVLVGVILATWLAFTIAWNSPRLDVRIFSHLPVGRWMQLLPSWSFFAPRPVKRDYVLLYRDRYDSGTLSAWREVLSEGSEWTLTRTIWNPGSRPRKALSDAVRYLLKLASEEHAPPEGIVVSVPYLLLLNKVSRLGAGVGVTARQFAIMSYSITAPRPEVVFVSHMHDLGQW
jgi:hypothetical protein